MDAVPLHLLGPGNRAKQQPGVEAVIVRYRKLSRVHSCGISRDSGRGHGQQLQPPVNIEGQFDILVREQIAHFDCTPNKETNKASFPNSGQY